MGTPFTQWECELAIWLADARGWPTTTPGWIGSCTAKMEGVQGFEEEAAQQSGIPYAGVKLLQEQHSVAIENLWTFDDQGTLAMPRMQRQQRFVAVFIWTDETTGRWVRRQYYNCTFNPFNFSSPQETFGGKVEMKAGYMEETTNLLSLEVPVLDGIAVGMVRYCSSTEDLVLYQYPPTGGAFTAVAETAGRAVISNQFDGTHVFNVKFNGVKTFGIKADGTLQCGYIEAFGGTNPETLPSLQFYMGPARYASIGADGGVFAPSARLLTANPGLDFDFELRDQYGHWLASFARTGLLVPAIDDTFA